ncbi:MAG: hypothetical protein N4A62_17505 [Marinisporobacter sp.]|jgi:hypothetical protein|nr:hypothetical protein [Marinisporobacter sp.]
MNFESLEIGIEENVLKFLSKYEFQKHIEEAKVYFDTYVGEEITNDKMMIDFNTWLIYDYKMKDGSTFIEKYYEKKKEELSEEEKEFIQKKMKSFLSIYEIKESEGVLEDIFTKKEVYVYLGKNTEIKCKDLIFGRIIEIEKRTMFVGNTIYIPELFKNSIERNILFKYEEYKGKNQYATWEEFLKGNSLLLQKHVDIIADVTNETENEDAYNVWQSIYLISDVKTIKELLQKHQGVQLDFEEEGSYYLKYFDQEELVAEMVLEKNRLELECNSENDRIKMKKIIESVLGDLGKHYKDEIIGLEDIV